MTVAEISQTFVLTKDLKDHVGKIVSLRGWLYNKRSSGKIAFLEFRDGYGFIQAVVVKDEVSAEVWEQTEKVTQESSLILSGEVSKHPKKENVYEIQVKALKIMQLCTEEYPISKKEHGPDFLLNNRHLWLRSKKQWAVQRIRNTIINAVYEYLNQNDFIKMDSPILTPNACEGTTTLFPVDYFDLGQVYLSQSGQLYSEAGIMSHNRVFDFGPVFRAEKSKTRRHLTEFWMMDAEMAFCHLDESMKIQEGLICHIVESVLAKNQIEFEMLERDIEPLKKVKAPFYYKKHKDVVTELRAEGSDIEYDHDLGGDDETVYSKKFDKPIFISRYPAKVKAFYMKRDPEEPEYALCADLIAPEGYGEIIGGSEREIDYDVMIERMKEHNLNLEDFQWYLDLRKYGSVPHSGFGIGLERIVAWICGLTHVRETIPFPRMIQRKHP